MTKRKQQTTAGSFRGSERVFGALDAERYFAGQSSKDNQGHGDVEDSESDTSYGGGFIAAVSWCCQVFQVTQLSRTG